MRHSLSILAAACVAAGVTTPAAAQLFQVPAQRTIVLSPGWHLAGPPVHSTEGLRFAVRSDAGVMRDMTVLPNGGITFSDKDKKAGKDPRGKAAAAKERRSARTASRRIREPVQPKPPEEPKKVTAKLEGGAAPLPPAAPDSVSAPAPRRAPEPAPAPLRTGPGFAHGVPINPLD